VISNNLNSALPNSILCALVLCNTKFGNKKIEGKQQRQKEGEVYFFVETT